MQWIVLGLIILYAIRMIHRKVQDFKKGKYCSCGCSDCPSKIKCHSDNV